MSTATISNIEEFIADVAPTETKVFYGVSWDEYVELSEVTLNKTNLKISYNMGADKISVANADSRSSSRCKPGLETERWMDSRCPP